MDLQKYEELKRKVDGHNRQVDRAAGALDEKMSQLKEEFKCETVQELKELIAKLEKKEESEMEMFESRLKEFKEKWDDDLTE